MSSGVCYGLECDRNSSSQHANAATVFFNPSNFVFNVFGRAQELHVCSIVSRYFAEHEYAMIDVSVGLSVPMRRFVRKSKLTMTTARSTIDCLSEKV